MINFQMKKLNILILLIIGLISACSVTQNISNNFMENDLNAIHPSFKIYLNPKLTLSIVFLKKTIKHQLIRVQL